MKMWRLSELNFNPENDKLLLNKQADAGNISHPVLDAHRYELAFVSAIGR